MGIPDEALAATVKRWNEACAKGVDEQFGRDPQTLAPLDRAPYYAFRWGPMLAWPNGGPRRDEKSRVLDSFGETIAGMFAAGSIRTSRAAAIMDKFLT